MPRHETPCDLPEILSVQAREVLFPVRERRVAVELTVIGRNLPCEGPPTTIRIGKEVLRNLKWVDQNTLRGVLLDRPKRPIPLYLELDYHTVATWESLDPDRIERL